MDFDDLDDYMKMHVFEKDADNSSNPAFLWGSDKLAEAQAEIERLTDQVVRQNTHLLSTLKLAKERKVEIERLQGLFKEAADYLDECGDLQSNSTFHWEFREEGDK